MKATNKTTTRITALILATILLMLALTACSGLSGTYYSTSTGRSYTFSGTNKVTEMSYGLSIPAKYKISGKNMEITYTVLGTPVTQSYTYEKKGKSIFLNGAEYVKQ